MFSVATGDTASLAQGATLQNGTRLPNGKPDLAYLGKEFLTLITTSGREGLSPSDREQSSTWRLLIGRHERG
jgi:hypothetical protein